MTVNLMTDDQSVFVNSASNGSMLDILANSLITQSPLGKKSDYITHYDNSLLFAIPRKERRLQLSIDDQQLPFSGMDWWNIYEFSCLNKKGKPINAIGHIGFPCTTPNIVESKSMKVYFNSFNMTHFDSLAEVQATITKDLSEAAMGAVQVHLTPLKEARLQFLKLPGICLDDLDISCDQYQLSPDLLHCDLTVENEVEEQLYSDLLKSNCLVTNQPDWASIYIHYCGRKINHESLLKYLISYRNHNDICEPYVERTFVDLMRQCLPRQLTVYACYTRRGGLDINPYRSNWEDLSDTAESLLKIIPEQRLVRQ